MGLTIGNRTNIRRLVIGGLACILLLPLGLAMSDKLEVAPSAVPLPAASASRDAGSKIRVNSDLVVIPVTVTDGKGRIVDEVLQFACVVGPEIANWQGLDLAAVDGSCALDGNRVAGGLGAMVMGGVMMISNAASRLRPSLANNSPR